MTTRYFKVIHKAGAFIDGIHYPPAVDSKDENDSIVPLELGPKDKAPLWGVEVDIHGNEIGERPDPAGVQDLMGDALANKIANNAGVGGTKATGTKQEAEQRKATIVETLGLLDHSNDGDWTAGGLPKVEVVASASGLEGLSRDEITEANPDFKREVKA